MSKQVGTLTVRMSPNIIDKNNRALFEVIAEKTKLNLNARKGEWADETSEDHCGTKFLPKFRCISSFLSILEISRENPLDRVYTASLCLEDKQ
jgi:hypothetical protein